MAQIEDLTPAETQWIADRLATAAALAAAYTGGSEQLPSLERLDKTWHAWHRDRAQTRPDANTVVNALGIAFGQHLADGLQLRWVIATDDYGTDLAVFGQPGDLLMFPANMVAKRVEKKEPPIGKLYAATAAQVSQLRRQR